LARRRSYRWSVARLVQRERDQLPDRCFAYVDGHGRRRLPIHDEAHVRNALARFNQVTFEDEAARERARARLLGAAKRFRIVPVGFIAGQLRSERASGRAEGALPPPLPNGFVTLLMTDIEGSTALLHDLGDRYGDVLEATRDVLRTEAERAGGVVVETRADEFFAAYESPVAALATALAVQRALRARAGGTRPEVRLRIGLHSGYPTVTVDNYLGMAVHTAARVCSAAHGGQVLVTADTRLAVQSTREGGVRFRGLGTYQLRGIPAPVALFQVGAKGLPTSFPPLRATLAP
jgi:class 3 adenylate cyclase